MPLTGATNIEISGKYAYITSNNETNGQIINTIDISDSVHPVNVGQITVPNTVFAAVEASGPFLFALASNGLYVYDASTPSSLKQVGFLANPFPRTTGPIPTGYIPPNFFDMAINGNKLYIVSGIEKLLAVDISNPAEPKIVSDFEMAEQSSEIIISGKDAYLLSSNDQIFGRLDILETVDISNPDKLDELKIVPLPGTLTESYDNVIEVSNHLYFCDNRYPIIQVIDLGNLKWGFPQIFPGKVEYWLFWAAHYFLPWAYSSPFHWRIRKREFIIWTFRPIYVYGFSLEH